MSKLETETSAAKTIQAYKDAATQIGLVLKPGDLVICHSATGNPAQSQTLSLSQNAANSHLANHPFDTTGPCPT
jgi:UDP-N-acetyl-D-mannosaminuronate dehydrogenase